MEAALFTMHEVLWHALKPPLKQDDWPTGIEELAVSITMVFFPVKNMLWVENGSSFYSAELLCGGTVDAAWKAKYGCKGVTA